MTRRFRNLEAMGNRIDVPIPTDEKGYLGRECPASECLGYFKVKPGTGLSGPGLQCHCPYCGHSGDPNTFWTPEQIEYAKSVAFQQFTQAVRQDLKQFEFNRPARGPFGIGVSMKLQPGPLPPLRYYREKQLETYVVCEKCALDFAVYGVFGYCPDCRVHNSLQVLRRNFALIAKQIELAGTVEDADLRRHLIEDALENCVSAFDGFAREACKVGLIAKGEPELSQRLSFQNLARGAKAVAKHFGVDLRDLVESNLWQSTERGFFKRHLLAHRSGVIDAQYLEESGDRTATVGRRIVVAPEEVLELCRSLDTFGQALRSATSRPSPGPAV